MCGSNSPHTFHHPLRTGPTPRPQFFFSQKNYHIWEFSLIFAASKYIMATRSNRLVPARATHPGEILREELQERGIKQKDFAQMIGVQPSHLNEVIRGKRNLNEDLAIRLEKHLGIPFKTWMSLRNGYVYECKALEERQSEEQRRRVQHQTLRQIAVGVGA